MLLLVLVTKVNIVFENGKLQKVALCAKHPYADEKRLCLHIRQKPLFWTGFVQKSGGCINRTPGVLRKNIVKRKNVRSDSHATRITHYVSLFTFHGLLVGKGIHKRESVSRARHIITGGWSWKQRGNREPSLPRV